MKSLNRNQLVLGGAVLLGLVGAGILGWMGLGALGEKQLEAQTLSERMGDPALAALLVDPAGIGRAGKDAAELKKLTQEMQDHNQISKEWSRATGELAGEGAEWAKDPGKWKDRLIAVQSALQKEAATKKVQMAQEFYLGLNSFRQKSPSAEEVPGLAYHLSVAERLVRLFLQAREIPEQYPTACEILSLAGPGSAEDAATQAPPAQNPVPKPGAPSLETERKAFRLKIRSSPEVLYEYIRLLSKDPALLIITNLSLENEKQSFPSRSDIAKKFAETPAVEEANPPDGGKRKAGKRLLEILAGEESLSTSLEIDFVAWKNPEDAKEVVSSPPAP